MTEATTETEPAYYTKHFDEIYPKDLYAVVDDSNGHVIAFCTNPDDAERVKALLVYYGDRFPAQSLVPAS